MTTATVCSSNVWPRANARRSPICTTSENNRRAKYYRLTRAGARQLEVEQREWQRVVQAMAAAIRSG